MSEKYKKPATIEELKAFCEEKQMPLEKMRFFIGEDYSGPKAYGIYRADDGDFVVYKNKSDGSRAVRYKGPHEDIAVNELYEKLKAETEQRLNEKGLSGRGGGHGSYQRGASDSYSQNSGSERYSVSDDDFAGEDRRGSYGGYSQRGSYGNSGGQVPYSDYSRGGGQRPGCRVSGCRILVIITAVIFAISIVAALLSAMFVKDTPKRGYYRHNGRNYYHTYNDWYYYEPGLDDWILMDTFDEGFADDYDDYYLDEYYDDYYDEYGGEYGFSDFYDDDDYLESYYDDDDDYNWDWGSDYDDDGWSWDDDDDYDWDYDDWDYGDSDWDSDW